MKIKMITASAAALALAACGGGQESDSNTTVMAMNESGAATGDNMAMGNMAAAAPAETAQNGQEYATMAAASDLFEIESSRLAAQKSKNAGVKEFAQMLIADHQKSTTQLQSAAQNAEPAVSVTPGLNPEQQANMEALQAASAQDFDRTYLQQQVQAHEKALALVEGYARTGEIPGLKQHASTVSAPIRQHLDRARQLSQAAGQ